MTKRTLSMLAAIALAATAVAQEEQQAQMPDTTPAPQVKQFAPLVGSFTGRGTFVMEPGAEAQEWTATVQGSEILDGHFVQVDEDIQTGMGPIRFRSIYGWDRERSKPVCFGVSNMGPATSDVRWVDDKTLVSVWHGTHQGAPYVDRWTMKLDDKGYAFSLDRAMGAAPFFEHVKGRFDRASQAKPAAPAAGGAPTAEMKPLQPFLGDWKIAGKLNMPGMVMDVTGIEKISWMYDGAVLAGRMEGESEGQEPGSYQCDWYLVHDPEAGCYRQIYATNMGEVGDAEARLLDGKLVITAAMVQYGEPAVDRTVIELGANGPTRCWSHRIAGTADPVKSFDATYAKAGAAGPSRAKAAVGASFKDGSCCAKAAAAGNECAHPCCVAATKEGKICQACNQ